MEEKQEQGTKLTLHDISQALARASDEELIEFAEAWGSRRKDALEAIEVWDYLTYGQQRAAFERTPWVAGYLSSEQKRRFLKKLDGAKYVKTSVCAADPATEPQKAPWWQFWK